MQISFDWNAIGWLVCLFVLFSLSISISLSFSGSYTKPIECNPMNCWLTFASCLCVNVCACVCVCFQQYGQRKLAVNITIWSKKYSQRYHIPKELKRRMDGSHFRLRYNCFDYIKSWHSEWLCAQT